MPKQGSAPTLPGSPAARRGGTQEMNAFVALEDLWI